MPHPISDELLARITEAVFNGRKIEAIKLYRDTTGLGLKESKEEVELIEMDLRKSSPEKFTTGPGGTTGCLSSSAKLLCLGAVLTATVVWFARYA